MGEAICERLIEGESLAGVCRDESMPRRGQVLRWLAAEAEFRTLYHQAKLLRAELLADELIEIARRHRDWKTTSKGDQELDKETVLRSRLRIDTRQWVLSMVLPRIYGTIAVDQPAHPMQPGEAGPDLAPSPLAPLSLTPQQRAAVNQALARKHRDLESASSRRTSNSA